MPQKLIDDVGYIRRRMEEIERERKLAKAQAEARRQVESAPPTTAKAQERAQGLLNQPTTQGLPPSWKKLTL